MRTHFTIQVARSSDLDLHLERLTAKLERLLWVFPPELVRLHGRLLHKNGREGTVCSLDLHLPTAQLNVEEAAPSAQAALHAAGEELTQQVKRHRQRLGELRRRRVAPMPPGAVWGDANLPDGATVRGQTAMRDLGDYVGAELPRLEAFVSRRLLARESDGEVPPGSVDAREVLDEVVVEALSAMPRDAIPASLEMPRTQRSSGAGNRSHDSKRPTGATRARSGVSTLNRERWFRILAERAIRRLAKANGPSQHGQTLVSLQQDLQPEPGPADDGEWFAPEEVLSAGAPTPELIAYTDEVIAGLTAAARRLPREQRHDLLLWLIEGFTPQEVAALSQRPLDEVQASLAAARKQIDGSVGDLPAELRQRLA